MIPTEVTVVLKHHMRFLLREIFDYNNRHIALLDNTPCKMCGNIPERKIIHAVTKKGKEIILIDRTSRIDCEFDSHNHEVYDVQCWNLLVSQRNAEKASQN